MNISKNASAWHASSPTLLLSLPFTISPLTKSEQTLTRHHCGWIDPETTDVVQAKTLKLVANRSDQHRFGRSYFRSADEINHIPGVYLVRARMILDAPQTVCAANTGWVHLEIQRLQTLRRLACSELSGRLVAAAVKPRSPDWPKGIPQHNLGLRCTSFADRHILESR